MCWTPLYTRNKTKTNTTKTQHNMCGHHYIQETRRRQTQQKHNTICIGHHYIQETRRRQIQQETQHNMCWTPLYTRNKTKTNTTRDTTQYVLDTTIYKKQDEDKYNKNTTQYVLDTTIYKKQDEDKHNKNTTQYVLDTTIYKTQDEDKYNKRHNTICVGHHYIQETRRRQIQQKHTTQYVLDTTIRKEAKIT